MPRPGTKHFTYYPCPEALKVLEALPARKRSAVMDHVLLAISRVSKALEVKPPAEKDIFDAFGLNENASIETKPTLNERIMKALANGEKAQHQLSRLFQRTANARQLNNALSHLEATGVITRREGVSSGGRCPVLWSLTDNAFCP